MLSQRIQEFINEIRIMAKAHPEHGVSCVLADKKDKQKLGDTSNDFCESAYSTT